MAINTGDNIKRTEKPHRTDKDSSHERVSTLSGSERRWRPVTRLLLALSLLVGPFLLSRGHDAHPAVLFCAAVSFVLLAGSNAYFVLRHLGHPTIGTIPVSLASLGAASLPLALSHATGAHLVLARVLSAVGGVVVVTFAMLFSRMRGAYAPAPEPSADAVAIVLGAAVRNGRPSPTLSLRLDGAIGFLSSYPRRLAVLSGGPTGEVAADGSVLTEADVMAAYLARHGIPRERVLLERRAANTRQNVELSLRVMEEAGIADRQVCVISNDYHLWRALRSARSLGANPVPVAVATPRGSRLQQWCREGLMILAGR